MTNFPTTDRREFVATGISSLVGSSFVGTGQSTTNRGRTTGRQRTGRAGETVLSSRERGTALWTQSSGNFDWTRTYGGSDETVAWSVSRTSDGEYLVAGQKATNGYVVRTDSEGEPLDSWTFPGSRLIASIEAEGSDAFVAVGAGDSGGWVSREPLGDSIGDRPGSKWRRETESLVNTDVVTTAAGPVVTGLTSSDGGLLFGFDWDGDERFIEELRHKLFGLARAHDGGFVLITGRDRYILKSNSEGAVQWDQTYGDETVFSGVIPVDNGYAVVGATEFEMGEYSPISGRPAIVRIDGQGNEQWRTSFDRERPMAGQNLVYTGTEFVMVGGYSSDEREGETTDLFVGAVSEDGEQVGSFATENGSTSALGIETATDQGVVVAGETEAYGATSTDALLAKASGFDTDFTLSIEKTGCRDLVPGGVAEFDLVPENSGESPVEPRLSVRTDELDGDWPLVRTGGMWSGSPPTRTLSVTPNDEYVIFPKLVRLRVPTDVDGEVTVLADAVLDGRELATASTTVPVTPEAFDPTAHGFGFENFGPDGLGHDHGKISKEEVLRIVGESWDFSSVPFTDPGATIKTAVALAIYAILEQFTDGHCYGMCLLVDEFFQSGVDAELAGDAEMAIDIESPADPLGSVIDERQQRQSFDFGTFLATQSLTHSAPIDYESVLDKITTAIDERGTALIGLGKADSRIGHQLLAYCYEQLEGRTQVYVYDPNYSFVADNPATNYVLEEVDVGDPTKGYRTLTFYTDDDVEFDPYQLDKNTTYERAVYLPPRPDYDVGAVILGQFTQGLIEGLAELFETGGDLLEEGVSAVADLTGLGVYGIQSPAELEVVGPNGETLPAAPEALIEGTDYEQIRVGYDIDPNEYTIRLTGTDDGEYTVDAVGVDSGGNVVNEEYSDGISEGETVELTVDSEADTALAVATRSESEDDSTAADSNTETDSEGVPESSSDPETDGGDSDGNGLPDWVPVVGLGVGGGALGVGFYRYLSDSDDGHRKRRR